MALFDSGRPAREPFLNAPASVLWLIVLILAAHAVRVFAGGELAETLIGQYGFIPARYAPGGDLAGPGDWLAKAVPFVSYLFLHADFGHAGINCLWLLAFGPAVARRLGTVRFFAFFFFCGIVAALAHLAANWGSDAPAVGASGAISGLMAAGIRILYGARTARLGGRPGLAPIWLRPVLFFTVLWSLVNILSGMIGIGLPAGSSYFVAWEAHLGGYFAGLLFLDMFDAIAIRKA